MQSEWQLEVTPHAGHAEDALRKRFFFFLYSQALRRAVNMQQTIPVEHGGDGDGDGGGGGSGVGGRDGIGPIQGLQRLYMCTSVRVGSIGTCTTPGGLVNAVLPSCRSAGSRGVGLEARARHGANRVPVIAAV